MSDANSQLPSNVIKYGTIAIAMLLVAVVAGIVMRARFGSERQEPECFGGDEQSCVAGLVSNCTFPEDELFLCMKAVKIDCKLSCDPTTDWSQYTQCDINQLMCLANGGGRLRCGQICR